jgi:hypothetical protein
MHVDLVVSLIIALFWHGDIFIKNGANNKDINTRKEKRLTRYFEMYNFQQQLFPPYHSHSRTKEIIKKNMNNVDARRLFVTITTAPKYGLPTINCAHELHQTTSTDSFQLHLLLYFTK